MSTSTITPPQAAKRAPAKLLASATSGTEGQLIVAVALLFAFFAVRYGDTFLGGANVENMSRVAAIMLVVAIGQMFALIVGGFDISVGANMGVVSVVVALQLSGGASVPEAVALGLLTGAAIGLVNGILISLLNITPFVATLGMLTFLGGFADELSDGTSVSGLPSGFASLGGGDWGPLPSSVGIALVVLAICWFVLARSRAGLYLYAIGGSRETSRVSGVRVKRYEVLAYTACGLLAGVAGVMLCSRVSVGQSALGQGYELLSIATAAIGGVAIGGGTGRLRGVVLGVILLTVLTTGLDLGGVNQFVQQMVLGCVLVGSVLVAQRRGRWVPSLLVKRRRAPAVAGTEPAAGG